MEGVNPLDILARPAEAKQPISRAAALLGGADTGAYVGLSLGDLVYDRVRMDPLALEAFAFVHKPAEGDIYQLATWAHHTLDGGSATVEGRINRLQGYVFERMAASILRQDGTEVLFPDNTNNPGWDFKVNGVEAQAKCGISPNLVTEHFAHHPSIERVYVNQELAAHFVGDERVVAVAGVARDAVRAQTDHSLHAAADMLDLNMIRFVPLLSVARNLWAVRKQQTDWMSAVGNVAVDGTMKTVGVAVAGKLGMAGAAHLCGGWPAILAPVFASTVGYRGGRVIADQIKRRVLLKRENQMLNDATRSWCIASARVLSTMIEQATQSGVRFRHAREQAEPAWRTVIDDWLNRLEAEQAYRLLHQRRFERGADDVRHLEGDDPTGRARHAMILASRVGIQPADLQTERKQISTAAERYAAGLRRRLLPR